jgi:hypothetical protein
MSEDPKLHYFTIATKPNENLDRIVKNIGLASDKVTVLGTHENAEKKDMFGFKLQYLKDFIGPLPDTDIVLYTDSYDIIINATLAEVKRRFLKTGARVLFAAERGCWPDAMRQFIYRTRHEDFPYLNAGAFIGYVGNFRQLLDGYHVKEQEDDQRLWTTKYLQGNNEIEIDHKNDIFFCTYDVKREEFDIGANYFRYKTANPIIIHCNGAAKLYLTECWEAMCPSP